MNKKWWKYGVPGIVLIVLIAGIYYLSIANLYQTDGKATLKGLSSVARVIRDEKGMPYIYASNLSDLIKVQGYVTAQDRLFQMHLTRLFAEGRLTELAGGIAKELDVRMRTIGLYRNAVKHAKILDRENREMLQAFADGVNQFIAANRDELQLEFKLAGVQPEPWKIEDSLAIIYYMGWGSAANMETEMVSQMLLEKIGLERYLEIFPVNTNPDDTDIVSSSNPGPLEYTVLEPHKDRLVMGYLSGFTHALGIGSNAWVSGGTISANGKPIVASDPQLDARLLPGIFYPTGLITPEIRVVGATVPGIPGAMVGRNQYVANGVTNAYGDAQDLFIETLDPDNQEHYLENGKSIPFHVISETLKIKDKSIDSGFREEVVKVRLSRRGPVISGVLKPLETQKVVTMRWAPFETMQPSLGIDFLLKAKSTDDIRDSLRSTTVAHFNIIFADIKGNLGWQATGRLPIRNYGNGTVPVDANRHPNTWAGWIPYEETPHQNNSDRDWIGNANHNTVKKSYPYYYSSYFSPYYRYQRIKELMSVPGKKRVEDHWEYQRDDLNVFARRVTPIMAKALASNSETSEMADILNNWDYHDSIDSVATTIFQTIYRHLAKLTYEDELGTDLAATMLNLWYFWQERLEIMIVEGNSSWFDIISTPHKKETLTDLIQLAALKAKDELSEKLGKDIDSWKWGKVHHIVNTNPIRRKGFGKDWLGGGSHAMGGSGETLYRALYDFNNSDEIKYSAALRMVADLADGEKVVAVMHGGVTGRTFHSNFKDQIDAYHDGSKLYWWFSDKKIQEHKKSELTLIP
jgi:penicillin amidase